MHLNGVKTILKSPGKILISVFVLAAVASVAVWLCLPPPPPPPPAQPPPPDPLLPYVKLESKWTFVEFNDFTSALNQDRRDSLKKALKIGDKQFNSKEEEMSFIRKQLLWLSSHWMPYTIRDENKIPYHEIVQWTAGKLKVDKNSIAEMTTFELERKILEATFATMWDKLTPEQRAEVLNNMDKDKTLDRAGIAAMSGAGAIAALSATVYLSGFAFYTTMSSAIAFIGTTMGVTLPMSAYLTASSTAALLSGPVGWGIATVAVAGGCWLIGGPDAQTTAAAIIQIHYTKVQALHNSGISVPAVKIAATQYNNEENYYNGEGGAKNPAKAFEWYRKSAEQGVAKAQNALGVCYYNGEGVAKDSAKAVEWYRKAADQGLPKAQCNLGLCYNNGEGVVKDEAKAVEYYRKAAAQGYADAQYNLGVCYYNGEGVAKDEVKAVEYYRKAAAQGNDNAVEALKKLVK